MLARRGRWERENVTRKRVQRAEKGKQWEHLLTCVCYCTGCALVVEEEHQKEREQRIANRGEVAGSDLGWLLCNSRYSPSNKQA